MIWVARSLHLFSVIVWLGGLMFQAAVTFPVARVEDRELDPLSLHIARRFQPFVWMRAWTLLVTGGALVLFDSRYQFFRYDTRWAVMLGIKQLLFLIMMFFAFGYVRMLTRVRDMITRNEPPETMIPYHKQMVLFARINVGLGLVAILIAAGMRNL